MVVAGLDHALDDLEAASTVTHKSVDGLVR